MKKKLTLLFTLLTLCVSGAWAAVTDLPNLTTDENSPKLYVIKNTRSGKYIAYRSDSEKLRQIDDISSTAIWYFTEGTGTTNDNQVSVRMKSYFADGKAVSSKDINAFNNTGTDIAIAKRAENDGVSIDVYNCTYDGSKYYTAMNDAGNTNITIYFRNDAGSVFVITSIDDILEDLKTQYSAKVDGCATLTDIFSSSDCATAKTAITNATTGLEIIEAYETLIATANDQLISLKSHDAEKYVSFGSGIKATDSEGIIKIVSKHDLVAFQNPETNQYISCPFAESSQFLASDTPDYFHFVFNSVSYSGYVCLASSNARTSSGTLTMHDANNGSGNIVTWYSNAPNSFFLPASKTLADLKTSIKSKLDALSGWQPLYSSSDISTAKTAVDAASTVDDIISIYEDAIKAADGKLLSIENKSNAGKYMSINATNVTTRTYPTVIKLLVNDDLTYSLQGYLNFEGYYAEQLKNVNYTAVASSTTAGKYRLGYLDDYGFCFYSTEHSGCLHYSGGNIVRWYDTESSSPCGPSYWTVSEVNDAAYLGSYYNALLPFQATYGQYGYYKSGSMSKSYFDENIIETSAGVLADLATNAAYITPMKNAAKSAYDNMTAVVPVAGDFLRIKASADNKAAHSEASDLYLTSSNTTYSGNAGNRAAFAVGAATDNTTIFYFDGTNLTSFSNGLQAISSSNFLKIGGVGAPATSIAFEGIYSNEEHAYRIEFNNNGRSLYTQKKTEAEVDYYFTDAAGADATDTHYRYFLEKVTSLPVTISSVGYSTLYSPVALTIPGGITAYIASDEGDYLHLTAIEGGKIPANTGVILAGTASTTYNFDITTGGSVDGNVLTGTSVAINRPDGSYVLATGTVNEERVVGFFAKGSTGATTIPGFKAYLAAGGGAVKTFRFDFDDETGINEVNGEGINVVNGPIYNLAGQRLNKMQKGINIVNGKKVLK